MKNKDNIMKFEVPRQRTRAHVVLFCENTPFKPKVVESKRKYTRNPKHKNSINYD